MCPVFFSVKKIRPSGVNLSETGKLRLVRIGVTGDAAARACDKKCGAINRTSMQVNLIASLVDFGSIESNRNSVRVTITTKNLLMIQGWNVFPARYPVTSRNIDQ